MRRAEQEARARGFYGRLGYTCFGELVEDYPQGFARYFMTKRLAPAAQSDGRPGGHSRA